MCSLSCLLQDPGACQVSEQKECAETHLFCGASPWELKQAGTCEGFLWQLMHTRSIAYTLTQVAQGPSLGETTRDTLLVSWRRIASAEKGAPGLPHLHPLAKVSTVSILQT